jgi:hypothetical protein
MMVGENEESVRKNSDDVLLERKELTRKFRKCKIRNHYSSCNTVGGLKREIFKGCLKGRYSKQHKKLPGIETFARPSRRKVILKYRKTDDLDYVRHIF